jgi:alpha-N-acetylglucosamine transferase
MWWLAVFVGGSRPATRVRVPARAAFLLGWIGLLATLTTFPAAKDIPYAVPSGSLTEPARSIDRGYVMHVYDDDMAVGTLVLLHSLNVVKAMFPRYVCTLRAALSPDTVANIEVLGAQVLYIEALYHPVHSAGLVESAGLANQSKKLYRFTKLQLYNMIQFNVIVYLDSDMVVLKNIDVLFDFPPGSAVTFRDMVQTLPHTASYNGGDQGFFNAYFHQWSNQVCFVVCSFPRSSLF